MTASVEIKQCFHPFFQYILYNIKDAENRANGFISQKIYKNVEKASQINRKTGKPGKVCLFKTVITHMPDQLYTLPAPRYLAPQYPVKTSATEMPLLLEA